MLAYLLCVHDSTWLLYSFYYYCIQRDVNFLFAKYVMYIRLYFMLVSITIYFAILTQVYIFEITCKLERHVITLYVYTL